MIRLAALLILAAVIVDLEFIILTLSLGFFHISSGIKTIIQDYIHIEKVYLVSLSLVRVCYVELIRYSMELFM